MIPHFGRKKILSTNLAIHHLNTGGHSKHNVLKTKFLPLCMQVGRSENSSRSYLMEDMQHFMCVCV